MENYKLRLKDFIPVIGLKKYFDRNTNSGDLTRYLSCPVEKADCQASNVALNQADRIVKRVILRGFLLGMYNLTYIPLISKGLEQVLN